MLESIRQIGIFMIVAQTVMHFAANGQYEKYMKIIAGVIVLLLFIRPFISGSDGQVIKWQEEITHIMEQIEARSGDFSNMAYGDSSTEAQVIRQIEEEITRRLNEVAADYGCRVVKTAIELTGQAKGDSVIGEAGAGEYVFDRVRVTVRDQSGSGERQAIQSETGVSKAAQTERSGADEMQMAEGTKRSGKPEETWSRENDGESIAAKDEADRIRIGEITVKVGAETGTEQAADGWGETAENMQELKQLFAQTLGIAEDRVEVVYLGGW
ncbi:MAG: stage III sporulation protein AF [Lachnospiraceae bacterium]|nr:stage III sporulation protein AF [Lachnospiraceae bacterium]